MIAFAALLFSTLLSIELVRRTKALRHFSELGPEALRAVHIVTLRHVSEWAKERAVQLMAGRLMRHSLRGLVLVALIASPFIFGSIVNIFYPYGFSQVYKSWSVRFLLIFISIAWILARRRVTRVKPEREDGIASRTFQRLALGNRPFLDMSFDIERTLFKPCEDSETGNEPVFVTGLARAGTTILTRLLHEQGEMASLTYRDLPFPLAPNTWAALSAGLHRQVSRRERGHGDGIFHDLDSAEAIEEVFWRFMEEKRYVRSDGLSPVMPEGSTIDAFHDYVGLVRRRYNGKRYLSKNNANVLRLPALIKAFPQALIVHPFRDPLQQAQSLRRQHALALKLAAEDPFRREFTRWLGHYEFGPDQRPFLFPGYPDENEDKSAINYWLRLWICVYTALLDQPQLVRERQIFVDYDVACATPDVVGVSLTRALGLTTCDFGALRQIPFRPVEDASPDLVIEARAVHETLRTRSGLPLFR